jgi:carbamoyltransferase
MSYKQVIGIHNGHNSSVALVRDGILDWAVQEERFTRIKNQGGLPENALRVLCNTRLNGNGWPDFALGSRQLPRYHWQRQDLIAAYSRPPSGPLAWLKNEVRRREQLADFIDRRRANAMAAEIAASLECPPLMLERCEHHLSHAAAAYYGWGRTEPILILTCDGSGDGLCATVSIGKEGRIERIASVEESHSIGRLYANCTHLLGMVPLEHEYKLMGLAPYAERSRESQRLAEQVGAWFEFDPRQPMTWRRRPGCPPMQAAAEFLARAFKRQRFDHIAAGIQMFTERFLVNWVRNCIRETGIHKVTLSGGVFMNVKANQRILDMPEVEELFVFPSCGDESNAIGSAWLQYHHASGKLPDPLGPLYLGDGITDAEIEEALRAYPWQHRVTVETPADIEKRVAELLAQGAIVARCTGRMEFGARALGNRSILASAAVPDCVSVINEMIKCRDFWMPFAASILAQRSVDYLDKRKPMPAPYMIMTFNTRPERRHEIAAGTHPFDHTCRPQEVYEHWNPEYYKLLQYFEDITGIGGILNTSLNLHGEPMVANARDALRVFDVSGLRYLALGRTLLSKQD